MNHEKHANTKINLILDDVSGIWASSSDKVRLEIIKSIVYTADNQRNFREKVVKMLESELFKNTLD